MVSFKELREVVLDPLIEFADHARKMASELEQFSAETDTQKKILHAVWAGMDAIAAIQAITGNSNRYKSTSTQYREVDNIVQNLTNRIKWAKEMLESAISSAPSIPGFINDSGTITINYAALGPNPAPAAISAAESRARQVNEYMRQALEIATEADRTAQSALAQLLDPQAGNSQANPKVPTTDPVEDGSGDGEMGIPEDGDGGTGDGDGGTGDGDGGTGDGDGGTGDGDGGTGDGDGGTGDGDGGTGDGDGGTGDGDGGTGDGDGGTGDGDGGTGDGDGGTGGGNGGKGDATLPKEDNRSSMQKIGDLLDGIGEALSGGDGIAEGERSGLQIFGDVLEGIGEALSPGDGSTPDLPDPEIPAPGDPGEGDPGTGDPGTGDPGEGDPGTGDPGTGDPGEGDPGTGDPGTGDPGGGSGGGGDDGGSGGDDGSDENPGQGNPGGNPGEGDPGGGSGGGGDDGGSGGDDGSGEDGEDDGGDGGVPGGVIGVPEPVGDLNQAQMAHATEIIEVGRELGISERGQAIAIATALQESTLRNLANSSMPDSLDFPNEGVGKDHDSVGLFQQRPSQGWGTIEQCMNPEYAAGKFYEELQRVNGWENMELTEAAQAVQRSAYPDAYAKWETLAYQILEAHK